MSLSSSLKFYLSGGFPRNRKDEEKLLFYFGGNLLAIAQNEVANLLLKKGVTTSRVIWTSNGKIVYPHLVSVQHSVMFVVKAQRYFTPEKNTEEDVAKSRYKTCTVLCAKSSVYNPTDLSQRIITFADLSACDNIFKILHS